MADSAGVGVRVGVLVGCRVAVAVAVGCRVGVTVAVGCCVTVSVGVGLGVGAVVAVEVGSGVAVTAGVGDGVSVGCRVAVSVGAGLGVGIRVGEDIAVATSMPPSTSEAGTIFSDGDTVDESAVAVTITGTEGMTVFSDDGVGVESPPPPSPITNPAATSSTASPPSPQAHMGTRCRWPGTDGRPAGITTVLPCSSLTVAEGPRRCFAGFRFFAISLAFCQRSARASSIAFITVASVCLLTSGTMSRNGMNCSGSATRCVAVGGVWPVSAW